MSGADPAGTNTFVTTGRGPKLLAVQSRGAATVSTISTVVVLAALVADTPTAQFISADEIKGSVVVGRFPSSGEHFGMVFSKGNPLAACVNQAIAKMKSDGTLDQLTKKWLQVYTSIPSLEP